ncbi:hypothetical protein HNP33_000383 [Comamonas odontotermitis]|uniref:EcoEI R protein C-terminal domain-containing protein n=1 Tax=Comamonas odontotermitis TaxID=379895 RepID=A0ABR6RAZ6_9BURK|nr:type I restriction-modification enzyme R subunit C-terminal domain-containing protein [Comamonas odontotermitis]MBB6576335.1 hypothetical protein [Comamonas odontotermitis]
MKQLNLGAARGVAVREYPTDTGPADYVLFVDRDGAKTRFVLIDAVGVEKSLETESRPLEKKPGMPLKDLPQGVAMGSRDNDTVLSLANRLVRLAKQLDDKAKARIEKASGGIPVGELGKALITALDPDAIVQAALATAKAKGITRTEDALLPQEIEWLRLMKDHAASSCSISRDDFDYAVLADKGVLEKAWGLFGKELDTVMREMNEELVA